MNQKPTAYASLKRDVDALSGPLGNLDPQSSDDGPSLITQYCKPPYVFLAIPVVLGALLIYMKPSCVMEQNPNSPDSEEQVLSYKKLGMIVVVITGIIAGGPIRSVCEVLGIQDVVAKSLGSANPHNVLKACVNGLKSQNSPKILSAIRGKKISDIVLNRETK